MNDVCNMCVKFGIMFQSDQSKVKSEKDGRRNKIGYIYQEDRNLGIGVEFAV